MVTHSAKTTCYSVVTNSASQSAVTHSAKTACYSVVTHSAKATYCSVVTGFSEPLIGDSLSKDNMLLSGDSVSYPVGTQQTILL